MALTPEEGKIGNHLATINVDKMNSDEIRKMMDLIDRKIELLESKTGYESTITNLNSLSVNLEKADKKLADFFNSNPDLIIYRNNLSIEQINERIDNASASDPFYNKTKISESTNTITSNIADASAKISRGLNTFKLGLKIIVGTALSLTGIGLIAGIPLLKSASKQNKARRARQREERKISRELEEQTRDQKGSSATLGNLLAGQNLTTEQLYYILDHDDLRNKLEEDAYGRFDPTTGKTKNFGLTKSQVINLRKQLERVKALQDPSKQTKESSKPVTVAQDNQMDELYEKTKSARKNARKNPNDNREFETRLKFIISGNEDDLSKEDKAALEIYYMNDSAYKRQKGVVETCKRNDAPAEMKNRDIAEFKMYQAIMRTESGTEADSYKNGIEAKLRVLNGEQEEKDLFGAEITAGQPYTDIERKVNEIKNFREKIRDAVDSKNIVDTSYKNFMNFDIDTLESSGYVHKTNCESFFEIYNDFISEFNSIKTTNSPEQYLRDLLDKEIDKNKRAYTSSLSASTNSIDQARRRALNNCGKMDNVLDYYNETENSTDPDIRSMRDDLFKYSTEYNVTDTAAEEKLKDNDAYKNQVADLNSIRDKVKEQTINDFLKGYCSGGLGKVKEVVDKLKKLGMEPDKIQELLNQRESAAEYMA